MKFIRVNRAIKLSGAAASSGFTFGGTPMVQSIWDSEDGRYRVATTKYSHMGAKGGHAIRVSVQRLYGEDDVIALYGRYARCFVCEDDGVVAFVVKELMDMVGRYGRSYGELFGRAKRLRSAIGDSNDAMKNITVSLATFAAYRSRINEIR